MRLKAYLLLICTLFLCLPLSLSNIYPLKTEFQILNKSDGCVELRFLSMDEGIFYFKDLDITFANMTYKELHTFTFSNYFSNKYPLTILLCFKEVTLLSEKPRINIEIEYSDTNKNVHSEEFHLRVLPQREYSINRIFVSNLTEESYVCYTVKINANKNLSIGIKYNISGNSSVRTLFYSTCKFTRIGKNEYSLNLSRVKSSCIFCIKAISNEEKNVVTINLYVNNRSTDSAKLFLRKDDRVFTYRGYYIDPIILLILAYILKKVLR